MQIRSLLPLVLLISLGIAALAQKTPPPAGNKEEAAVVERQAMRVHCENDGTGFRQYTAVVRIQSEAGVQAYGQLVFGYSSATENLEVNYVRVRKPDGQMTETPAGNFQDFAPEVLRSAPMYSDYRERHVTVVGLRPGDTLEYQTTTRVTTALASGQFWYEYDFPKYQAVTEARLDIELPKDRTLKIKSPERKYTSSETGDWRTYSWVVTNIVPDRKDNDDAADAADTDDEEFPDVQVTTFADWNQVAAWYARLQGERVVVDDSIRSKAAELTRGASTPTEKARRLYDFVAQDYRYVSLSFGIGRLQPHAAPEVLKAGYGDCKDKHTLLAALLRAVNIPSYPVLIGAGRKLDVDVPSPAQFNHVITAARIEGRMVWLDTTAEVAPFGLIMPILRGQDALLASEDSNAGVRKTPLASPVKNSLIFAVDGKVAETGALDATIDLQASGDNGLPLRVAFRSLPQADWKRMAELLAIDRGVAGDVSDIHVDYLADTTKPLHVRYHVHQDNYFRVPSPNASFFPFPAMAFPRLRKTKTPEPLKIGPATEVIHRTHVQFAPNYSLRLPSQVSLTRDYADYSTTYQVKDNVLDAVRSLKIKVEELPPARRADVESLRTVVMEVPAQTIQCSIRPAAGQPTPAATVPVEGDAKALRKAATKAMQQRDYKTASELLKRVVEQEPKNQEAWYDLGRAYTGLSDDADAITAFQKQVEVNPYHQRAYDDLGWQLQKQGKIPDAIAAYRKQVENVPLDRFARKNLGLLLFQTKQDKDAIAELEGAIAVPPADAEIDLTLAQLYLRGGAAEKAKPLLMRIVGAPALSPGSDLYAAALRDDVDTDQALRDARRILDDLGEQFDAGAFNDPGADASSAMGFVSLAWARTGWAKFLKGDSLEAIRYLNSAWMLSQSGVVAERLARLYEKSGQAAQAKRLLALAAVAGGGNAEAARAHLLSLDPAGAERAIAQAKTEFAQMGAAKVPGVNLKSGSAEFRLVFDGSEKPEKVEYVSGDPALRTAEGVLLNLSYPVLFPDVSSVKIVRRGTMSCGPAGCALTLKPAVPPSPAQS